LITGAGENDAIARCRAYCEAGADGIMIHSKAKTPDEVFSFVRRFRAEVSADTPIVVVPTTYAQITESELSAASVNIVIYANHLLRAAYPAMKACAESVLACGSAIEASAKLCMPIGGIVSLL
jgi:phosphoenolpyruvate phosphomutase